MKLFAPSLALLAALWLLPPPSAYAEEDSAGEAAAEEGGSAKATIEDMLEGQEEDEPATEEAGAETPEPATDETASDETGTAESEPAASGTGSSEPDEASSGEAAAPADEAVPAEATESGVQANFDGTPDEKGQAIAEAADAAESGYKWSTATGRMILRDAHGNSNERAFESRILEDPREGDDEGGRGIIVFLHPPDIKNTALLTVAQKRDDDYQWLYLPALKRVKRISGSGKTGSFVGSEFSFEDLGSQAIEDYAYTWLRDEACPDHPELNCHVLERRPKDNDSGYSRIVAWLDDESYRTFKSEFYDRKGTLLKTLTVREHQLFKDRFWEPMSMIMVNAVNGKSTEMLWSAYDFDTPLNENDFTVRALERLN